MDYTNFTLFFIFIFISIFVFHFDDRKSFGQLTRSLGNNIQTTITAESGQNVTLTCRAPSDKTISAVEWKRTDLGDEYVLLYRDGHFQDDDQHPSFKNRVDLQDRQMKDGDVSLILKNVTIYDTGTYKCHVVQEVGGSMTLINSTNLVVVPPGQPGGDTEDGDTEDGSVGLIVGLSVFAVLLVAAAVVGFLICRKHKQP